MRINSVPMSKAFEIINVCYLYNQWYENFVRYPVCPAGQERVNFFTDGKGQSNAMHSHNCP
jgi:hypothetical protein